MNINQLAALRQLVASLREPTPLIPSFFSVGEKVPGERLRGIRNGTWRRFASKHWALALPLSRKVGRAAPRCGPASRMARATVTRFDQGRAAALSTRNGFRGASGRRSFGIFGDCLLDSAGSFGVRLYPRDWDRKPPWSC
jgi:hypothetical protein